MKNTLTAAASLLLAAFLSAGPAPARAQYPSKPVRLIVPAPPGGGNDTLGRILGQKLRTSAPSAARPT